MSVTFIWNLGLDGQDYSPLVRGLDWVPLVWQIAINNPSLKHLMQRRNTNRSIERAYARQRSGSLVDDLPIVDEGISPMNIVNAAVNAVKDVAGIVHGAIQLIIRPSA
ncbi:hypothetical protein FRC01_013418 [Tulasnella sp. 417]|nr:hypothetical protein FRC01_013418 [Tulasnella sp. 417]